VHALRANLRLRVFPDTPALAGVLFLALFALIVDRLER